MADDSSAAALVQKPVMGRRERKKLETRANILRSAKSLFLKKGYYQTTVEDIADLADVSKPTLFNYFTSKSSLLTNMAKDIEEDFQLALHQICQEHHVTSDRLVLFYVHVGRFIESNRDFARAMLVESLSNLVKPGDNGGTSVERLKNSLRALLADGIMRGDVTTDFEIDLLLQMIVSMHNSVLLQWLSDENYPWKSSFVKQLIS